MNALNIRSCTVLLLIHCNILACAAGVLAWQQIWHVACKIAIRNSMLWGLVPVQSSLEKYSLV